jgi:hypothetical protein
MTAHVEMRGERMNGPAPAAGADEVSIGLMLV